MTARKLWMSMHVWMAGCIRNKLQQTFGRAPELCRFKLNLHLVYVLHHIYECITVLAILLFFRGMLQNILLEYCKNNFYKDSGTFSNMMQTAGRAFIDRFYAGLKGAWLAYTWTLTHSGSQTAVCQQSWNFWNYFSLDFFLWLRLTDKTSDTIQGIGPSQSGGHRNERLCEP